MFRTIFGWVGIICSTVVFGTIGVFTSLTFPDKTIRYSMRPWGRWALRACGVKVEVEGEENLPKEPCIVMYNHQSSADIFAYAGYIPIEWKAVIKKDLIDVPFIGWVPKLSGHYFVERDGTNSDMQEIRRLAEQIKAGPSVMMAPEGTRSHDGKLLPFKKGGFVVAMRAGVPVVPLVIMGGKEVISKGSKAIHSGTMKLKILPPINVKLLPSGKEGRDELMRLVREAMEKTLAQEEKIELAL